MSMKELQELQKKTERLQFLLRLSELNPFVQDADVFFEKFCIQTNQLLGWSDFRLVIFDKDSSPVVSKATAGIGKLPLPPLPIQEASTKIPIKMQEFGFRDAYLLPLTVSAEPLGWIEFYSAHHLSLDQDAYQILKSGAEQLCSMLERYRSQKELQQNYIELQSTQSALIQSEKLASIGTIASGIAHEINNPLSFLLSNLETLEIYQQKFHQLLNAYENGVKNEAILALKKKIEFDYLVQDQKTLLTESLEGIHRINEIVKSLKTFARNHEDDHQNISINDCIVAALRVASHELKYKCDVEKNLETLPWVKMNPSHLLQVLMNILINAAQAMDKRGRIRIHSFVEGDFACISIEDTGTGMSEVVMKKLFTPFFTTKPVGKGTGLGLSVSYGIIKKIGGEILVKSTLGMGTTFTVKIPVLSQGE